MTRPLDANQQIGIDYTVLSTAGRDQSLQMLALGRSSADIIVMATRGLSTLRGAIMGSVSHALIEKATCPVLIVK